KGLEVLKTLPDTPERIRQELNVQITLGPALMNARGQGAPEVEYAYIRACECSRQVGDPSQLFTALRGLWSVYLGRGELQTAYEQGEHLLRLAHRQQEPSLLLEAHRALGTSLFYLGELVTSWTHLERGIALYEAQQHRTLTLRYGQDPGMACLVYTAWSLW